MKKRLTSMLLVAAFILNSGVTYAGTIEKISANEKGVGQPTEKGTTQNELKFDLGADKVYLNGEITNCDVLPIVDETHLYVPIRFVTEALLGSFVSWDEQTVRVKRGQDVFVFTTEGLLEGDGLTYKPYDKEGTLMLHIDDIAKLFDVQVSYDETSKVLTLVGEDERINHKPISSFIFNAPHYVAGQNVQVINTSTDVDGDKIVDWEWSVRSNDQETKGETISELFKTPKAGHYTLGLRVQDIRGLWSDWQYEDISIGKNNAPVITALTPSKASYAQGEKIELNYTYDNESWENITNEKWMYRKAEEPASSAVLGKPEAFFTSGDYIVTLQIDDTFGNKSAVKETTIHITGEKVMSEFEYHFTQSDIGNRIDNYGGINYRNYDDVIAQDVRTLPGVLMMSDSPEVVKTNGVLYESIIEGEGRLLVHHLNQLTKEVTDGAAQKLMIIAENPTDEVAYVTLKNESMQGPATDIMRVGQKVLYEYLEGTEARTLILQPGEKVTLYEKNWTYNGCISGLMDVETKGKVNFIVASVPSEQDANTISEVVRLPKDGVHISGTFDTIGIESDVVLEGGKIGKLLLGAGGEAEWVKGIDTRTDEIVQNKGNFGVTYRLTFTAQDEDMGIFLNSRGGAYKGAIKWVGEGTYNLPTEGVFGNTTTKAAVLGVLKQGETKTLEYMLPNGSAAPILLGFVPRSLWHQ